MRVLAAVPLYPPDSLVGAWLATHRFLAHLASRGHEVSVMQLSNPRPRCYTLDGVKVTDDRNLDVAVACAHVVISHLGDAGKASRLAAKWDKPNVRIVHGRTPRPAERLVEHGCPDLVVVNSDNLAATLDWDGPLLVAHPPTSRVDASPGGSVTQINMSAEKGAATFWALAATQPHRSFTAVLGGYGHQVLERHPNVEVLAPTVDIASIYRRTRVLLVPSEFESWGMVGVEAASCGIPVIAHPSAGVYESLGDAAIYVDRGNIDGWSTALDHLDDPDCYADASTYARQRFDTLDLHAGLDRFADAVEALCAQ